MITLAAFCGAADAADPGTVLDNALELLRTGDHGKALTLLSGYRPAQEELFAYHEACARALERSEKYHDSLAHHRLAFIYAPDRGRRAQALVSRGDLYLKMRNYPEAALVYGIFLTNFRDSADAGRAHLGLANAFYRMGRYTEAQAHYRMSGTFPEALAGRARTLHFMGRLRESAGLFQSLLDSDRAFLRSSSESVYLMGENFRLLGELPEAKLYLSTIVDKPWKQWADRSLGLIAAEEGRPEAAVKFLQAASMSADRKLRAEATLELALIYAKLGRTNEARTKLIEIRNAHPFGKTYDRALIALSGVLRSEGKPAEARIVLNELVFRHNPPPQALDELQAAMLAAAEKEPRELATLWRTAGRRLLDPARSEALLSIARGLKSSGKARLELLGWIVAQGTPEAKSEGRLALAEFYAGIGEPETALRYLQGAKVTGHSDGLMRAQAGVFFARGEYQKSFANLRNIRTLTADDLSLMADLTAQLGKDKAFLEFFGRALESASGGPALHMCFAEAALSAGRKSEASEHYAAALTLHERAAADLRDDRKWCLYRIAGLSGRRESVESLNKMRTGGDVFGRYAHAALREASITETMERIF